MAFRILARTILELGAELISSDGIALYELIKNAIDAGSKTVRIEVRAPVLASQFEDLFGILSDGPIERDQVIGRAEYAFRQPRLIAIDPVLTQELFKRLQDAPDHGLLQEARDWYCDSNWIKVKDTGHGMTLDDLDKVYLTIGTRSRRVERESLGPEDRAPLGEKGVGRLSTMRLGDLLEVETSRAGELRMNLLNVDWGRFSHESDQYLEEVPVSALEGPIKDDADSSGTTVTIRGLRTDWTKLKLETIAQEEFAKLVDPFEPSTANNIIRLYFGGQRVILQEIDRRILGLAHGTLEAKYRIVEGRPELRGSAEYVVRDKQRSFRLNVTDLMSVVGVTAPGILNSVGAFDMEMWWFNRRLLHKVDEIGTRAEITKEVSRWSGGLMLFRDGYRVNPYGGANDDWLELDKRAFAAKGFKLNRQQVVGRVRISWRNQGLTDQTNREGLTETAEKRALVKLLQHLVLTEFKAWTDREDKAARIQERTTLDNIEEKIEATEADVRTRLRMIERALPDQDRHLVKSALDLLKELTAYLQEARQLTEEVANDRAQLVHLAGIGLMVELIMHELARTTSATLSTLDEIDRSSLQRSTSSAISVLSDQLVTLSKRVENLDPLSAARRQRKEVFDVFELVRQIVEGRAGQIARHKVSVSGSFLTGSGWRVTAVRGMLIQIIENLLANSFYWLKRQADLQDDFRPEIVIEIDPKDGFISITDNGPGIDPELASEIFQPFVTRKPAGEGHGLGLYISRELAGYHGWRLDVARAFTIHPDRYNTFILETSS